MSFENREEFKKEIDGRSFVVLDQGVFTGGFWCGAKEVQKPEDATVYNGDFNTQQEFDSFNRRADVKAVLYNKG